MVILHKAQNFEEFLLSKGNLSVQGPRVTDSNKSIWCIYTLYLDDKPIGQYCEVYREDEILAKQCYSGIMPGYKPKDGLEKMDIILLEYTLKAGCSLELLFYERIDMYDSIPFP